MLWWGRRTPLTIDPSGIPKPAAILITHVHYDHLDLPSFKYFTRDIPVIVPDGSAGALVHLISNPVIELSKWSKFSLGNGAEICALPARHPGGRFILPYRYRTCLGYAVTQNGETLVTTGDSGYQEIYEDVGNQFKIRLAIIDCCFPAVNGYQRYRHMDVPKAMQCWEDFKRPDFIPFHFGTFFGGKERADKIRKTWRKKIVIHPLLEEKLHLLDAGESLFIPTGS